MKEFLKMTLAVICGIIIASIISIIIGVGFIGALTASGSAQPSIPKSGVLWMDMSKFTVAEQNTPSDPMSMIQGTATETVGIMEAVNAINAAAEDPAVQYIYIKADNMSGGTAHLQELRTSLAKFRKSGKAIVSYISSPTTGNYYLASVADKVYMTSHHGSTIQFFGVGSQLIFLKDLLDKLGVNVQLIRHGKYKSAGEMYIKNAPSEENLEQNQVMISSIWSSMAAEIAESRSISVENLNNLLDNLLLNSPEDFLNNGLVDGLMTREELESKLADLAVEEEFSKVKFINFQDYVAAKNIPNLKAKKKIAVIYADGEIVDGVGKKDVAGSRFAKIISDVKADSTVKAVVFRVNSPGGSVLASEYIKTEIDLLKKVKPVVASYGEYAASGGYWISAACDKIFANPTTLTGSIGVFSMIPDVSGTLSKVAHVNVTYVNSNKHSDIYSMMRPLDEQEKDYFQASVEDIYTKFVNLVAEGRNLDTEFVDSIAQGRVWSGSDAIKLGLVDELGTLEDAITWAAAAAGDASLADWNVTSYPTPPTTMESIMEMFGQNSAKANVFSGTPFENTADAFMRWSESLKDEGHSIMFARMPYDIAIR